MRFAEDQTPVSLRVQVSTYMKLRFTAKRTGVGSTPPARTS
jgi:hypothetical protein